MMNRMVRISSRFIVMTMFCSANSGVFAECQDPTKEAGRFLLQGVEMTDTRTGLVWLRCPAGYVGPTGSCDSSRVLPSNKWENAMQGVVRTPKTPPGSWRLASVEELETIAAKECGYLVNDKYIGLLFPVWTSSSAGGDMVWVLDENGRRIKSKKNPVTPKGGDEFLAQALYVRTASGK